MVCLRYHQQQKTNTFLPLTQEFDVSVVPYLLKFNQKRYWVDYDEETDTLYISFRKPQCADDSIMKENLIYHYAGKKLVGVTILQARELKGK